MNNNNNNYGNYNLIPIREKRNIRDKRDKGRMNYSECEPDLLKRISFMAHNEYKGACFACDVGCSVSRSGYSPMNYSPYNNLIRRRDITPLRNGEEDFKDSYNIRVNKNGFENDNNYYVTED